MKSIWILAIILAAAVVAAGAAVIILSADDGKDRDGSVTVIDFLGREVTITSTERIVSVSAVPTSILCGLGLSSSIVAVSSDADVYKEDPYIFGLTQDDFPKAINDGISSGRITQLGGMYHMSAETMAQVSSDLVICDNYGTNQEIRDAMDRLGMTYVVVSSSASLKEIENSIAILGKTVGKESAAERMISEMESVIGKISDWCGSIVANELNGEKYNVAMMMTGVYAIGPNYLGGDILKSLHVNNVFESVDRYAAVTKESIASANPDVLMYQNLGMGDGVTNAKQYIDSLYSDPVLGGISAAENGRIFATSEGAKNSTSFANHGIVRAYAIYAMFVYKDFLTFEISDVFNSDNYIGYISQFWEMINS